MQTLIELKGDINSNIIITEDFNNPLSTMDRSYRQKIHKEKVVLNDTLGQMNLTDIYRTFQTRTASRLYILLKCTWNILQNRSHVKPQNKSEISED